MLVNRRLVILLDLSWTRDKDPRIPLGHASLVAALRNCAGIHVHSIVRPVNVATVDCDELASEILAVARSRRPENVDLAIGAYVWGEVVIQRLLPRVRSLGFQGRIILGGPQISYAGPGLEDIYPDADVFVRGYGEEALVALALSPRSVRVTGVHYAGERDTCEQAKPALERLPSPWLDGKSVPTRFLRWETQRGCPYQCAFCQHQEAGAKLARRELETDRVNQEIDLFCRNGVSDIAVLDPIFNTGPRATATLERLADRGYRGKLSLQCRAELVTAEFIDAARRLDVKLEFGLQTIHVNEGRAVQRQNNVAKVDATLDVVRAAGIDHEVSLIFGLPEQTLESFQASVSWCLDRRVPVIRAFPLMLLRGTRLERDRARWGLRESSGAMPVVIGSDSFNEDQWFAMARVSEALRLTEQNHPRTMQELLAIAESCEPDLSRWMPVAAVQ